MSIFWHRYSACANKLAATWYYLLLNVSCSQILHEYCTNIARRHKQATRHNWATRHTLGNTGAIEQQTRGVEHARFSRSWRLCSYLVHQFFPYHKNQGIYIYTYTYIYEHKRHDLENRAFSTPLVCCSIAPVLLSVCHVAQLCRVARLCILANFLQYLCTRDIEQQVVASSSKFIGACTVSMLKNWHYLIESCLDLNLNLGF